MKPSYEELEEQLNRSRRLCDAALANERVWETAMMQACGEDGPKSVADKFSELKAQCAALAAENAGLKDFVKTCFREAADGASLDGADIQELGESLGLFGRETYQPALHGYICGHEAGEDTVYVMKKTPATDAFLAEVRARVWVEGNEPTEFGRYWVRYETDTGPQYCSAKWIEHNFCAGSDTNIHKIWLADHSRSINSLKGVTHYTMLPEPIEGGAK
ncbi:hypothetical protein [Citrobacter sedlakii]|uniref:hypothetical protein n=1 Tax=Citrobacter sedlakii TaxID=67826 RepID=UPI001E3A4BA8|nr:hypothetical protein [Citrobacter sedlakii]